MHRPAAVLPLGMAVVLEGVEIDAVKEAIPDAREGQADIGEGRPAHHDDGLAAQLGVWLVSEFMVFSCDRALGLRVS